MTGFSKLDAYLNTRVAYEGAMFAGVGVDFLGDEKAIAESMAMTQHVLATLNMQPLHLEKA